MRRSMFFKIFIAYIVIAVMSFSIFLFVSMNIVKSHFVKTTVSELERVGITLKNDILEKFNLGEYAVIDSILKVRGIETNLRFTLIKANGDVVAESYSNFSEMENHNDRIEIKTAKSGKVGISKRKSKTTGAEILYVAIPVFENDKVTGILRTSIFWKDLENVFHELFSKLFITLVFAFTLMLLPLIFLYKYFSSPISNLIDASKRIAEGDFHVKVLMKNTNELKDLADSFNYMTDRIRELFYDISLQKDRLNSILSTMKEGLVVIDAQDRIILASGGFSKISSRPEFLNFNFRDSIANPEFTILLQSARKKGNYESSQMEINNKIYIVNAIKAQSEESIILTFFDISEIKNIEKLRKDFVMNVSHELKTPLTAMKGFIETMEDDCSDEQIEYLQIIKRHTDRLIKIVEDLIMLSSMESDEKLIFEDIDLKKTAETIIGIFTKKAEEKNIRIILHSDILPIFHGDRFKIEQIFVNLIDNSIKYTDSGSIDIEIMFDKSTFKISVKDTGIGIPEADLSRIFERFYVVDKSRSRINGGTGLGLSIVKHIILLHKGTITAESILNQGTVFTIILPIL